MSTSFCNTLICCWLWRSCWKTKYILILIYTSFILIGSKNPCNVLYLTNHSEYVLQKQSFHGHLAHATFPRFSPVTWLRYLPAYMFSCACNLFRCFPAFSTGKIFPVLSTGSMFFHASQWLDDFPRLLLVSPVLLVRIGYSNYLRQLWLALRLLSCDWFDKTRNRL